MPDVKYSMIPWEEWKEDKGIPDALKEKYKGLFRIQAGIDNGRVKPGSYGGFIEDESCLDRTSDCWVDLYAAVRKGSVVKDSAMVGGWLEVTNDSKISGNCTVTGEGQVCHSDISGNAFIDLTNKESGIFESIIRDNTEVLKNSTLKYCLLQDEVHIEDSTIEGCTILGSTSSYYSNISGIGEDEEAVIENTYLYKCNVKGRFFLSGCSLKETVVDSGEPKGQNLPTVEIKENTLVDHSVITNSYIHQYESDDPYNPYRTIISSSVIDSVVCGTCVAVEYSTLERSRVGLYDHSNPKTEIVNAHIIASEISSGIIRSDAAKIKEPFDLNPEFNGQIQISNSIISDQAEIHDRAVISESCILDKAYVCGDVKVSEGAHIGGMVTLRDNVSVHGTIILDSEEEFFGNEEIAGIPLQSWEKVGFHSHDNFRNFRR